MVAEVSLGRVGAAGDTAVLGTINVYTDSTMSDFAGTIKVSYVVTADPENADSVIMELIEAYTDALEQPGQISQFEYALTAAGSMSLQSLSIQYPVVNGSADLFVFTVQ
jgi:hypothetical protein